MILNLHDILQWVEKGFVFVYLDKGQLKVNISTELKKGMKETTINHSLEESDGFAVFYHHAKMMKNIYGFINIKYLVSTWNRYYKVQLMKRT